MLIPIKDYAARHGVTADQVRARCKSGLYPSARLVSGCWHIDSEEPLFPSSAPAPVSVPELPAIPTRTVEELFASVDMLAECAHALSMLPCSHKTIDALFSVSPGKYFSAAALSPSKNHPALSRSRAQHEVSARRALGILSSGESAPIYRLLRSANREIFDAIYSAQGESFVIESFMPRALPDACVFTLLCVVAVATCALLSRPLKDSALLRHIGLSLYSSARRARDAYSPRDEVAVRRFHAVFGAKPCGDYTSLYPDAPESSPLAEAFDYTALLACSENIDIEEYTHGCTLAPQDAAPLMRGNPGISELATRVSFLLLLRGIRRDRDYAMELYRDCSTSQTARLADELAKQKSRCGDLSARAQSAEQRAQALSERVEALERENTRLTRELETHESDDQELVALREALYEAVNASPREECPLKSTPVRSLPDRVIVIGGTETFCRPLSEVGARTYPVGKPCPPAVISGAREVWFQVSGLPHSEFYPAISAAREHRVPVYYFSSTGSKRCLAQLLEPFQEV